MSVAATSSRSSAKLCDHLRELISAGEVEVGDLVPSVRELSRERQLAPKTVHRALKVLAAEGLVASEPGRGYRVLRKAAPRGGTGPIAYLLGQDPRGLQSGEFHDRLLAGFRAAASARGRSLLALSHHERSVEELVEELKAVRCGGVALDTTRKELIAAVKDAGIPAVMVDAWVEDAGVDCVMQDGFLGGTQAAGYLAAKGCRKIAWFGPLGTEPHSRDRLGGTVAGLISQGLDLPPEMRISAERDNHPEIAEKLMSGRKPPEGIVALWLEFALALKRAGDKRGMVLGKDYELVGWCADELYDHRWLPNFGEGPVAPAISWSIATMAETAVARMNERRENPKLAPLRVKIPTSLKLPD
ncbi:MAG: GntR family transcriptional regulator [Planctomycetota bacterium]|jgi:DNA-binding LacI/PurR family transcriptional regulator